ncbi:ribonuclease H-like domain-containing protein [Tanacetum coccineum]
MELNVARSLMFQGELSLYLWSKCILTVVFIINMIPSSVSSGKFPFYFMYGHDPSLYHFRAFGYLCYATILNNQDMFSNDDNSVATSIKEKNTHPEGNVSDETNFVGDFYENTEFNYEIPDLPVNTVRSIEPTRYEDDILDNNWIDAMNAKIEEDVYMTIPQGFFDKNNKNKGCKLVKSLYGLKQAPRKWNEKLLVYVDDIVVKGNCVNEIDKFTIFLKSKFNTKDLENLKYFLGIEVLNSGNDICLSQIKYCLELLRKYGLQGCKPLSTPMEPNSMLSYIPTDTDLLLDNITGYQKLLSKLIYLTQTKLDMSYSVLYLAQYMHSLISRLNYALNVLGFLKNAPGKGIKYAYTNCDNNLQGYSDAD